MSARGRSENSRTSPSESPISRPLNRQTTSSRTTPIVPRGQERPRISIERSRSRSENCCRRDVITDSESGLEDTSPTFPRVASSNSNRSPSILPCRTPSSSSPNGRSTPVSTPLFTVNARGSCCDHERQFDALQRKLAALTEKIDNLQGSSNTVVPQRRNENLPRDMVACVHKVVTKLKEKDPPTEWTFEQDHSFSDDTNLEVTRAIERGVQATSAFKEADPVLLERAIKTYYKTLKAKSKRVLTRVRKEGLPQVANKQEESIITARRNQRCHNKLKSRRAALRQSVYSEEKKRKLEEVLAIDYMSPEESIYESNSDEDGQGRMTKLVVKRFEWRSDELTRELKSLDRKANRARSERGKRMMVKREEGGFVANSLRCYPKSAPAWALSVRAEL